MYHERFVTMESRYWSFATFSQASFRGKSHIVAAYRVNSGVLRPSWTATRNRWRCRIWHSEIKAPRQSAGPQWCIVPVTMSPSQFQNFWEAYTQTLQKSVLSLSNGLRKPFWGRSNNTHSVDIHISTDILSITFPNTFPQLEIYTKLNHPKIQPINVEYSRKYSLLSAHTPTWS